MATRKRNISKKKYSKKRYSKKRYSKKRYSKKRYSKKNLRKSKKLSKKGGASQLISGLVGYGLGVGSVIAYNKYNKNKSKYEHAIPAVSPRLDEGEGWI